MVNSLIAAYILVDIDVRFAVKTGHGDGMTGVVS
jgi:hypothetical protein